MSKISLSIVTLVTLTFISLSLPVQAQETPCLRYAADQTTCIQELGQRSQFVDPEPLTEAQRTDNHVLLVMAVIVAAAVFAVASIKPTKKK